jgi:flagella basal body P-ring formation protein FlgA
VYVPVSIESEIDVLVLRNTMPRDAHVSTSDLDTQRRRVPGLSAAYISSEATLRDQHLKRGTPAGTTLTTDLLTRDLVVKRGQQVVLVFSAGGLAVQAPGLALADGGTADRIRVQNQTSLKVVEGVIESGNLVRVGM